MNALCNQQRSPLEHHHIEPGLDWRAGSSMSNKRLVFPDVAFKALVHAAIGFV